MTPEEVLAALREAGAVLSGHFVLSSGRHSDVYVEKFRALERPALARALGEALAARLAGRRPEVVLSPAVGGIVLGFATALALGVRFVFAEREGGALRLRRGFEIARGERVAVVDDVLTTGRSLAEVLELVSPGELAGIGCLLDRSRGAAALPLPPVVLTVLDAPSWEPGACPLCARGEPAAARGSRHLAAPGSR